MKMYLQGLNYREMAEQELASETVDQDEIKKKANAIKKQFTRQGTGTIDRFKNVIADCSRKYDLSFAELIN
jgi:RNA polymerase sigma-70 factor (ECF subfamily)